MLITSEQRAIANQLNKMETFSKLNPPDAVRIKIRVVEKLELNEIQHHHHHQHHHSDSYETTSNSSSSSIFATVPPSALHDPANNRANNITIINNNNNDYNTINFNNPNKFLRVGDQPYRVLEIKKFCVDPQITSYDILTNLIAQAFGIKCEFQMSYMNRGESNSSPVLSQSFNDTDYITLFNDWDLDAAFLNSSNPYLSIVVEPQVKSAHRLCKSALAYNRQHSSPASNQGAYGEWEVINSYEGGSSATIQRQPHHHRSLTSPVIATGQHVDLEDESSSSSPQPLPLDQQQEKLMNSTGSVYNFNKNVNIMNLDPNSSGRSSLIALWSNNAADKAVSVFQRMFQSISSRSNSFSFNKSGSNKNRAASTVDATANNVAGLNQLSTPTAFPNNQRSPRLSQELDRLSKKSAMESLMSQEKIFNPFDMTHVERSIKVKGALCDAEFKNFLDSDGRVVQPEELRQRIFEGGIEPNKRKEIWPILLEVFPNPAVMTAKQRTEFLKQKSLEYDQLKRTLWHNTYKQLMKSSPNLAPHPSSAANSFLSDSSFDSVNTASSDNPLHHNHALYTLAHKIHKDVWRTDRQHKFYSGDSNKNIESLFNILMTYSLAHNSLTDDPAKTAASTESTSTATSQLNHHTIYAQGMSDLLSPLLFVLRDESLAYWCFCSLIRRCASNFNVLSDEITTKIALLSSLLARYDKELWEHLKKVGADQLLFVYRWLLIECKREFPFADSLRVLEVMWSTLPSSLSSSHYSFSTSASATPSYYSSAYNLNRTTNVDYMNTRRPNLLRSMSNASNISFKLLKQLKSLNQNTTNCFEIKQTNACSNQMTNVNNKLQEKRSSVLTNADSSSYAATNTSDFLASNDELDDDEEIMNQQFGDNHHIAQQQELLCKQIQSVKITDSNYSNNSNGTTTQQKTEPEVSNVELVTESTPKTIQHQVQSASTPDDEVFESGNNIYRKHSVSSTCSSIRTTDNDTSSSNHSSTDGDHADLELDFYKNYTRPRRRLRQFSLNYPANTNLLSVSSPRKFMPSSFNDKKSSYLAARRNMFAQASKSTSRLRNIDWFKEVKHANKKCYHSERNSRLYKSKSCNVCVCVESEEAKRANAAFKIVYQLKQKQMAKQAVRRRCTTYTDKQRSLLNRDNSEIREPQSLQHQQPQQSKQLTLKSLISFGSKFSKAARSNSTTNAAYSTHSVNNDPLSPVSLKERFIDKIQFMKAKWSTPLTKSNGLSKKHYHNHHHRSNKKKATNSSSSKSSSSMKEVRGDQETKIIKSTGPMVSVAESDMKNQSDQDDNTTEIRCDQTKLNTVITESKTQNSSDSSTQEKGYYTNTTNNSSASSSSKHSTATSAFVSASSVASLSSATSSTPNQPTNTKKDEAVTGQAASVTTPNTILSSSPHVKTLSMPMTIRPIVMIGDEIKDTSDESQDQTEEDQDDEDQEQDLEELIYSLSRLDNPFLLFLCLSLFIENRDHLMNSQMDANDIACYFDKMTRRHNAKNTLNRARYLYTKLYLAKANVFNYIQQLMEIQNSP